jgi:hypothetical protein
MDIDNAHRHGQRPARRRHSGPLVGLAVLALTAGSLVSGAAIASAAPAEPPECGPSPVPTFFTDAVAQPPLATPDRPGDATRPDHYTLTAKLGTHQFSSQWPAVPSLGYSTANAAAS